MYLMMPPKAYLWSPYENPDSNYFPHSWVLLIWNNWNVDDKIEQGVQPCFLLFLVHCQPLSF